MSLTVYTIAGMQSGSTVLRDIRSQNLNNNLTQFLLGGSGTGFNTFVGVNKIAPVIDFTTGDIKRVLGLLTDQIALAISADFYIWFQKCTEGGLRASGTNHVKGTIAKGMLIPVSLRLSNAGAELTSQLCLYSADGSTSPLTTTASQALVASAGAGEAWTLGPVTLNGTAVEGVRDVTINFGIGPKALGASGLVYPTWYGVLTINPTITVTANSLDEFISWGLAGAAQSATDSTIEITDCTEGGVRGSSPIICTIDEGMFTTDNIQGADQSEFTHSIRIQPIYDGSALPLAWSGLT